MDYLPGSLQDTLCVREHNHSSGRSQSEEADKELHNSQFHFFSNKPSDSCVKVLHSELLRYAHDSSKNKKQLCVQQV